VSMNTQAVQVERVYMRPIMSAFHALFSGGGLLGSLVGAAALRARWDIRVTLLFAATAGLFLVAVCTPRLLARTEPIVDPPTNSGRPRRIPRKVLALSAIAFALLMAEGVANDWSTLQLRDRLYADEATAALAFGAFSVAMTLGRLITDRVSGDFGRVGVVRWGSLLAAAGFALVIVSTWVPLTLSGWALCGLGLAGGVPQVFTAAGNLGSSTAATDMSRVFGLGYLGLLAGPAVIGWLTELIPLTTALVVPFCAMLLCAWFARVVATSAASEVT
jgi:hypothetical protein